MPQQLQAARARPQARARSGRWALVGEQARAVGLAAHTLALRAAAITGEAEPPGDRGPRAQARPQPGGRYDTAVAVRCTRQPSGSSPPSLATCSARAPRAPPLLPLVIFLAVVVVLSVAAVLAAAARRRARVCGDSLLALFADPGPACQARALCGSPHAPRSPALFADPGPLRRVVVVVVGVLIFFAIIVAVTCSPSLPGAGGSGWRLGCAALMSPERWNRRSRRSPRLPVVPDLDIRTSLGPARPIRGHLVGVVVAWGVGSESFLARGRARLCWSALASATSAARPHWPRALGQPLAPALRALRVALDLDTDASLGPARHFVDML